MSFRNIFYSFISVVKYQRMVYVYRRKINEMLKQNKSEPLSATAKSQIKNKFKEYGFNNVPTKWHRFYSGTVGNFDVHFIPEILFYSKIEPILNQTVMYPALEDKNLLEKFFPASIIPNTIIKNMNGF